MKVTAMAVDRSDTKNYLSKFVIVTSKAAYVGWGHLPIITDQNMHTRRIEGIDDVLKRVHNGKITFSENKHYKRYTTLYTKGYDHVPTHNVRFQIARLYRNISVDLYNVSVVSMEEANSLLLEHVL